MHRKLKGKFEINPKDSIIPNALNLKTADKVAQAVIDKYHKKRDTKKQIGRRSELFVVLAFL